MSHILDRFAASCRVRPQTTREFFALQLARKLGDEPAAQHYLMLADTHGEDRLLAVYRRASNDSSQRRDLAARFHVELEHPDTNGHHVPSVRLAAFRVERRSVAAAVFIGEHLDYTQVRHLSSSRDKVQASVAGFARWVLRSFHIQSTALESIPNGNEIQRSLLTVVLRDAFRHLGLPVWEVSKPDLLAAFGHPALRFRRDLRKVIEGIWPILNDGAGVPMIQDAAALGLYVQTERLFLY